MLNGSPGRTIRSAANGGADGAEDGRQAFSNGGVLGMAAVLQEVDRRLGVELHRLEASLSLAQNCKDSLHVVRGFLSGRGDSKPAKDESWFSDFEVEAVDTDNVIVSFDSSDGLFSSPNRSGAPFLQQDRDSADLHSKLQWGAEDPLPADPTLARFGRDELFANGTTSLTNGLNGSMASACLSAAQVEAKLEKLDRRSNSTGGLSASNNNYTNGFPLYSCGEVMAPKPSLSDDLMMAAKSTDYHLQAQEKLENMEQRARRASTRRMTAHDRAISQEQMRKVRAHLSKRKNNDHMKTEGWVQKIARSDRFENLTLFVVMLNAVWIGVDLDLNDADSLVNASLSFQVVENFFCFYFTVEVCLRFAAFQQKRYVLTNFWFMFDAILVSMMVLETWVLTAIQLIFNVQGGSGLSNTSIFRLLRLVRITRMTKLMNAMPELLTMMKGAIASMRCVGVSITLVFGVTYVFSILMRQLTNGTLVGHVNFPSVPMAAFTLLMEGMMPDNFGLMTELMHSGNRWWILVITFFMFLFCVMLLFMNMLVGVIVDIVIAVAAQEKEVTQIQEMRDKIKVIIQKVQYPTSTGTESWASLGSLGSHRSGGKDFVVTDETTVTKEAYAALLDSKDATTSLQNVGVDVFSLAADGDLIFASSGSDRICFDDFVDGLLQFRATKLSTHRASLAARRFAHIHAEELDGRLNKIEERLKKILDVSIKTAEVAQKAASTKKPFGHDEVSV
eukprot:TRINITY_DN4321_c0_g2_i1.p1 TRINITY_DN4321_c0_g2~~TRINITY_DN4321_c0_g2_i1.p1  ORF type:complete len:730 (-),score=178.59 TRINITY_DN4321_c0_g2_i1:152-2341(-)